MADEFFHILNPSQLHRGAVQKFFKKNLDLHHIWVERTSHPTHLETIIQWAFNEGRHRIALWGGDGTLSRAAQALYELGALGKMAVALVSVGTCNDFARKLGLPPWKKYVMGAKSPSDYLCDVGCVSTVFGKRVFVNNSGFGRTASAISKATRSNPIKDIFSFTSKKLDIGWQLNDANHYETRRGILAVVCNSPYFNNAMRFSDDVEPNDQVLNAFFENPQSPLHLLYKFVKCRLGSPLANGHTYRVDANSLRVESDSDLYLQVDGEPVATKPVRKVEYSILPDKLRLIMWR